MKKFERNEKNKEFEEKVIQVSRVSRTVKGGRRMSFRILVAVGNKKGKVGIGVAKSGEVLSGVQKAIRIAKKHLITVPIVKNTIPHEMKINLGSCIIFFKPASEGTSIIAGSSVRAVLELAGVKNILTKIIGGSNQINNARATILALSQLKAPVSQEKNPAAENKPVKTDDKK